MTGTGPSLHACLTAFVTGVLACVGAEATPMSDRARGFLENDTFQWVSLEGDGVRIHYPEESFAARNLDALPERAEGARRAVLRALDLDSFPRTIDVFYVQDRDGLEALTGLRVTGMSYTRDATVVVVYNASWRGFERHEMAHVISRTAWGEPAEPAAPALEGLAVFMDGDCGGFDVGRVVRTMLEKEALLGLDELLGSFRAEDDLVAYLQAATLIEHVHDDGGVEAVRELWARGLAAIPQVRGVHLADFEAGWLEWLRSAHEAIPDAAWARIRADGCGIDAAA